MPVSLSEKWVLEKPLNPFALVVGAGDVGVAFGRALISERSYRVIMTRRTVEAVKALESELSGAAWSYDHTVVQLDPSDGTQMQKFAEQLKGLLQRGATRPGEQRGLGVIVLASGKAILDGDNSLDQNMKANFLSKRGAFEALRAAGLVQDFTTLVVVSSRVLDFEVGSSEIATQGHYYTSTLLLENWAKGPGLQKVIISRVPLVAGNTANEYIAANIVPPDIDLVDARKFAAHIVAGL